MIKVLIVVFGYVKAKESLVDLIEPTATKIICRLFTLKLRKKCLILVTASLDWLY